jgi:hypothetical protein
MMGLAQVSASEVLGAMSIAGGMLMLWVARARDSHRQGESRPGDSPPGDSRPRPAAQPSSRLRTERQVLLSLCGLLLVAIGSMLARAAPSVHPDGCSLQLSAAPHEAAAPRCYHGAPRRRAH